MGTLDTFAQLTTSAMRDFQHAEQLIAQERAQLLTERDAFRGQREKNAEQSGASPAQDQLMLNVGGVVMRVDWATLSPRAHPVLAEVFSGAWDRLFLRDREGNIFLDLDPSAFVALHDILLSCERPGSSRRTLPSMQEASAPLAALLALFHLHGDFKHGPSSLTCVSRTRRRGMCLLLPMRSSALSARTFSTPSHSTPTAMGGVKPRSTRCARTIGCSSLQNGTTTCLGNTTVRARSLR